MTPELLAAATGCTLMRAALYCQPLTDAMKRWGIDTPLRQAYFLAEIAEETGSLTKLGENLSYSAERMMAVWPKRFPALSLASKYARNPQALANLVYSARGGNTQPGDGWKYRGRGMIQLTFRENYAAYAKASGAPALANPDCLLDPHYAADSAGWFWKTAGCNAYVDRRDIKGLTRRINGGLGNLEERIKCTARACKAFGVS